VLLKSGLFSGKIAVIAEIINHNCAIIDGPTTGVPHQSYASFLAGLEAQEELPGWIMHDWTVVRGGVSQGREGWRLLDLHCSNSFGPHTPPVADEPQISNEWCVQAAPLGDFPI
ncbi:hypothetical protein K443DRAFT_115573, partial [Laccaria amethystina LaAM-08-1]